MMILFPRCRSSRSSKRLPVPRAPDAALPARLQQVVVQHGEDAIPTLQVARAQLGRSRRGYGDSNRADGARVTHAVICQRAHRRSRADRSTSNSSPSNRNAAQLMLGHGCVLCVNNISSGVKGWSSISSSVMMWGEQRELGQRPACLPTLPSTRSANTPQS